MKGDVVRFLKKACAKWKMHAMWVPDERGGVYFVHINGRAIQTFTLKDFYDMPLKWRMFSYGPLIHAGLSQNLGEKTADGLIGAYKHGKKIA